MYRGLILTLLLIAMRADVCHAQPATDVGNWTQLPTLTTQAGLPSNAVYSLMYEPRRGTLLMGTENGLYRFDGHTYQYIEGAKHPYIMMDNLLRDHTGTLWCQDYRGNAYQLANAHVIHRPISGLGRFKALRKDTLGNIWALCVNGLARWQPQSESWQTYRVDARSFSSCVHFEVLGDTIVLNNRSDHLLMYLPATGEYIETAIPLPDREHDFLIQNNALYIWKRAGSVMRQRSKSGQLTSPRGIAQQTIASVSAHRKTPGFGAWIASNTGLFRQQNNDSWQFFADDWVTDVALDAEGTLWVSTRNNGIKRYVNNGIRHIGLNQDIRRVAIAKGGILKLGTDGGQVVSMTRTGQLRRKRSLHTPYEIENLYIDTLRNINAAHRTIEVNGRRRFVFDKPEGNLPPRVWDARKGLIVARYYPEFVVYPLHDSVTIPLPSYNDVYLERFGFTVYDPLRRLRMTDLQIADDGQALMLVSEAGLLRTSTAGVDTLTLPNGEPFLSRSICRLGNNRYLVATYRHGLWLMDDRRLLRELRQLPDAPMEVMDMASAKGKAILQLQDGICSFSPESGFSRVLTQNDGLLKNDIKTLQMDDNGVWLATTAGLTFVPYYAFEQRLQFQPLELEGVAVNGVQTHPSALGALPHDISSLNFKVHRTSLRFANRQRYSFRLANQSDRWQRLPDDADELTLFGLKPGQYELQIRSRLLGNPSSVDIRRIPFVIRPAWWNTWWFWGLSLLAVMAIGLVFYVTRVRRIRAKAALQTKVTQAELSALRAQMNPHFIFNALNSLQTAIIKADTLRAMRLLKTFARLLRTTVDYARSHSIPLRIEIEQIERYVELQQSRFSDGLHIDLELPRMHLDQHVPAMFIMPFIENAFEHGLRHKRQGEKRLLVQMQWQADKRLLVVVEDNGIGRAAAQATKARQNLHKSVGLLSVRERLLLYNQPGKAQIELEIIDLKNANGDAEGTRIELILPCIYDTAD